MEFNKNSVNGESSQIAHPSNYVLSARDDGLVREEKNNRVVSREDTTELTEIEDVRHYGDFSDAVSTTKNFFSIIIWQWCTIRNQLRCLSSVMISMVLNIP